MTTPQWGPPSPNPYPPQGMPSPYQGGYPQQAPMGYPAPGGYPQQGPAHFGLAMKRRSAFGVWVLMIITAGIYALVWYYKIHKEMAQFDSRRDISPTGSLLTIMFGGYLIVPPFVSIYNTAKRIGDSQRAAGLQATCSGGLGLLFVFVLGLWPLYYQSELNKVIDHYGNPQPGTQLPLAV